MWACGLARTLLVSEKSNLFLQLNFRQPNWPKALRSWFCTFSVVFWWQQFFSFIAMLNRFCLSPSLDKFLIKLLCEKEIERFGSPISLPALLWVRMRLTLSMTHGVLRCTLQIIIRGGSALRSKPYSLYMYTILTK